MTTLTLVTAAVCLFALPALGGFSANSYPRGRYPSGPYQRQGSYPYPPNRPYPYPPYAIPGYPAYPIMAQQGADGQGSQGDNGQSQGGQGTQPGRPTGGQGSQAANGQSQGGQGTQPGRPTGGQGGRDADRPNPPDAIAFSGNRKTTQYFFQQGPVIFNDVTTNIGGGYNSDYGVFTAFESGIYLVNYNVVSPREGVKTAAVDLFRNKLVINSASGSGSSGETSNSAVLFLNRHDQLSVQGRAESAVFCGDGGNDAFCSFNVALLKIGVFSDAKAARPVPGW